MGAIKQTIRNRMIPHSRPALGDPEAEQAASVIRSGRVAQGDMVDKFEAAFSEKLGIGHAAATSSGTAALHLALLAMGVKTGDEVIIPSFVCSALLHAVRYAGAVPVVADIDPATCNMDPADVKNRITRHTRAIIVPHMFGLPADLDRLLEFGIPLIEDCAQAVGSRRHGSPVGVFGEAAVYSFYATKVMTTAEGGMVVSGSKAVIDRVRDLREYDKKDDDRLRFNYRMTDVHAAIGLAQLERLDSFIARRGEIAVKYSDAFKTLGFRLPETDQGRIYFRYIIALGAKAELSQWIRMLRNKGVRCERPVFRPIHQCLGLKGYPGTEEAWRRFLSIPIYPGLTADEVARVIDAVTETCHELTGD